MSESPLRRRTQQRALISSAFADANSSSMPKNIEWGLLKHLASVTEDEGDEPRAA